MIVNIYIILSLPGPPPLFNCLRANDKPSVSPEDFNCWSLLAGLKPKLTKSEGNASKSSTFM